MKSITDLINNKVNEQLDDNVLNELSRTLNTLSQMQPLTVTEIKGKLLTKCAGYIIEEWIKEKIQNIDFESKNKFKFAEDSWYDFIYDNTKIEVKSFQKGKKYSNTKLTASQLDNKDQLVFILVEYTADQELNIINIEFVKGSELKIHNDRLVKK